MSSSDEWALDLGAPFHATSDRRLLHDLELQKKPNQHVQLADGRGVLIIGRGSVKAGGLKIPDVLYVEGLTPGSNIISVRKLEKDHGLVAEFDSTHCTLRDSETKREVGMASLTKEGKYTLDYLHIEQDVNASLRAKMLQETSEATVSHEPSQWKANEAYLSSESLGGDVWVLDCSARRHYTFNVGLLDSADMIMEDFRDGDLHILGSGSARSERLEVPNIHYVQGDDTRNIVSVFQLASDHGLEVVFEATSVYMMDTMTSREVGRGRLSNGMYVLEYLRISQLQCGGAVDSSLPQEGPDSAEGDWFGVSRSERAEDPSVVIFGMTDEQKRRTRRSREFYMDSGGCHHMTWNADVLKAYHPDLRINTSIRSMIRGDPMCPLAVNGIGYIDSKGGSLDRVLFVPDSDKNLVSISHLTTDYPVRVVFRQEEFSIKKLENNEMIGHGQRIGANYVVAALEVGAACDWVLDISAPTHQTYNRKMLYDFQVEAERLESRHFISLGHGSVRTGRFKVPGVCHNPVNAINVISVAKLADDYGLVTVFQPRICYVKHEENGQIVGQGHLHGGVYLLSSLQLSQQEKVGAGQSSSGARVTDGGQGGGGGRGSSSAGREDEERGGGGRGAGGTGGEDHGEEEGRGQGPDEVGGGDRASGGGEKDEKEDEKQDGGGGEEDEDEEGGEEDEEEDEEGGEEEEDNEGGGEYGGQGSGGQGPAKGGGGDRGDGGEEKEVKEKKQGGGKGRKRRRPEEEEKGGRRPAERDRFGLSRCDWRPGEDGAPRALAIRVGQAYYACASDSTHHTGRDVYILDSGATHHMSGHVDLMVPSSYMDRNRPTFPRDIVQNVDVSNGMSIPIIGVGNIVTHEIRLEDVLHVEGLVANLVSVSQLVDQLAAQVVDQLWNNGEIAPEYEPVHLHQRDWIDGVVRPLRSMGVPLLLVNELAYHMERLRTHPNQITGLARRIQGLHPNINDIADDIASMSVPDLLVQELKRQLQTIPAVGTRRRIENLARRICKAEMRVGQEDFSMKVRNLVMAHGARNGGLYHLLQLRPCPPIRLFVEPVSSKWLLQEII